ncbi:hypothetical protein CBR_g19505 [Chara braunii]|uniref:Reverse transcriptase domain-containing protein n=1 Tax=Chara braunii TaxID=69332 RepID=A0A388KYD7_CHABU|nr:hypothetical protein CBR_g19505 [Chara braunii]|eukprot:GBG74992.1 hypothetical protein CBR_g19505 [Chara braunii]
MDTRSILNQFEWTLGALRDAGFKIALEKSDFFLSEISFLGEARKRRRIDTTTQTRQGATQRRDHSVEGIKAAQGTRWTRDNIHPAANEGVELLIIQAWRTAVEGDLLGFVFGSVEAVHRQLIVRELLILLTQLLDNLSINIVSHCDESSAPHILSCTLTPYLHWSACLEGGWDNCSYPSHGNYLNPAKIVDLLFVDRVEQTSEEEEGEEEEEEEGDESEDTPEEDEYYSEHSEHESGAISEVEEEDESEEEEAGLMGTQEEDPAATERRRAEIAEGKWTLEQAVGTYLPIPDDLTRDTEPPTEEDERCAAEASSAPTRRRRSQSPSPSLRPSVRARADAGHRATSLVIIPSSP